MVAQKVVGFNAWPKMAGLLCPEAREEQTPVPRVDQGPETGTGSRSLDKLDHQVAQKIVNVSALITIYY